MPLKLFSSYQPSNKHINSQNLNVAAALANTALTTIPGTSPVANIVTDAIQAVNSCIATFSSNVNTLERLQHVALSAIAVGKLALNIALYAESETCSTSSTDVTVNPDALCKSYTLLYGIYSGLLLLGWGVGITNTTTNGSAVAPAPANPPTNNAEAANETPAATMLTPHTVVHVRPVR